MTYYKGAMRNVCATFRRPVGVLALFLHLGVGVAATSWEAVTFVHRAAAHVEPVGHGPCAPAHDEAHCLICQAGSMRAVPVQLAVAFVLPNSTIPATDKEPVTPVVGLTVSQHQPRAPPSFSL